MEQLSNQIKEILSGMQTDASNATQTTIPDAHKQITVQLGSDEHMRLAWKVFTRNMAARVQADTGRKLIIDEQIQLPLTIFIAWAIGHVPTMQRYGVNPKKGLLIYGNVGSGKSILFRTLRDIKHKDEEAAKLFYRGMIFENCEKIAKLYQTGGDKHIEVYTQGVIRHAGDTMLRNFCFDDLGNEEPKNHYGNYREVMKDVINERYDDFLEHGLISCFTTNLSMEQIKKRYDERTASRLFEMCNIIGIGTNADTYRDRRQTA